MVKVKKQAVNPFLPENEYIPDGEPYVFGNRVYLYGSHDRFGAPMFCMNDYVCWSAPVDDLGNWKYEGIIYRKNQDPKNRLGLRLLFAPDVAVGADGRYYLYYAFDFMGITGVAVGDSPTGPFEFYGHVHYPNGILWGRKKGDSFPFDPGVLVDDDKRVYLYSGFYTPVPAAVTGGRKLKNRGGYVLELESDMVTIKEPEKLLFPKEGAGAFPDHEFFEASSIRKYDGKYYFVYSSRHNHELCYAVSDSPTKGFRFGGTLVSNGDVFLNGNDEERQAHNYLGNTHGGMLYLKDKYYIFYHRHTNRCSYARQACAEELVQREDGKFLQAPMTSCGLNGAPLSGTGKYGARIACNLWSKHGTGRYDGKNPRKRLKDHPYFTQDGKDGHKEARQYIANMRDGAVAGFKYFDFHNLTQISVTGRGTAEGCLRIAADAHMKQEIANITINADKKLWKTFRAAAQTEKGVRPLFMRFEGKGRFDFLEFELE
ncbi:MAG: family 43 glycosylhydrolase [Eubacteriales bacterium]|nr:family 43 glycosylhydrolase [Eubacteriales bacterium]